MRRSPRRWWLYSLVSRGLDFFGVIVIAPLVIDPLFNKFEPLSDKHGDLVAAIETHGSMRVYLFHGTACS